MDTPPELLSGEEAVREAASRARAADRVAVDIEANGRFAYQGRACVVQLAWHEPGGELHVALIDVLRVPIALLADLLGAPAPLKLIHDVAFDARMLLVDGIRLQGVRDTHVAAQLCGLHALGLSALLRSELGIFIDKGLQQNDWSRRPLTEEERRYLAADVVHLPALDERLRERARGLDIDGEIDDDSAHKVLAAQAPPRDARPAHARVQGWARLDPAARAVLACLFELRDRLAQARDVPAGTLVPRDALVSVAQRRPTSPDRLPSSLQLAAESCGVPPSVWIDAVQTGLASADAQEPSPPVVRQDGRTIAARRRLGDVMARFRKEEAARRGVSEMVVLPARCVAEWIDAVLDAPSSAEGVEEALRSRMSLGPARQRRYLQRLIDLAMEARPTLPGAPRSG